HLNRNNLIVCALENPRSRRSVVRGVRDVPVSRRSDARSTRTDYEEFSERSSAGRSTSAASSTSRIDVGVDHRLVNLDLDDVAAAGRPNAQVPVLVEGVGLRQGTAGETGIRIDVRLRKAWRAG